MRVTRRSIAGLAASLPLLGHGRAKAQASPQVIVATYAGLGTPLWKRLVTDPFTKQTGITADVFASALPAASIAQSEGKPQFNVAVVAEYSVPGLIKRGLIELLTPDDIPGIRNVPEKLWLAPPTVC